MSNMYDICIVGAGIAGASLAAVLGRKGFSIALVDRNWNEPDGIIGELLQPGGTQKLKEMGLDDALKSIDAQPIEGYAMNLEDDWLTIAYSKDDQHLENTGFGFRYGRFVQNLRDLCQKHGNVVCIQGNVRKLIEDLGKVIGVEFINEKGKGEQIRAKLTIVCQGSVSLLAKFLNKSRVDIKGFMLGLIIKDSKLPYENHGHIMLADPSPILTYPVSKDKARVLIDFPNEKPAPKGSARMQYLMNNILRQMPTSLQDGFKKAIAEGNYKTKPTCRLASRPIMKEGVLLLGDSLNMRHPITGGGMSVALTDVKSLTDNLSSPEILESSSATKKLIYRFYRQRHRQNATINILSFALYSVFKHRLLKKACFNYLKKGGVYSFEPMSILSCMSRNRLVLFKHFFAVAGYALINRKKIKLGTSNPGLIESAKALLYSIKILFPLVLDEIPRVYRN